MKKYTLLIVVLTLCACTPKAKDSNSEIQETRVSKLNQLIEFPTDSIISHYDLSGDSITDFPNLSEYTIYSLDLSYNYLDTVLIEYLPKNIQSLNLSHNELNGCLDFKISAKEVPDFNKRRVLNYSHTLRSIDVSYNQLTGLCFSFPLRKVIASNNDITYTDFNNKNLEYLDISNNPNFSNIVNFMPNNIDTILRNGISNEKPLVWALEIDSIL